MCTLPLTREAADRGHRGDPAKIRVYCTPVRIAAAPLEQALTVEVPSPED